MNRAAGEAERRRRARERKARRATPSPPPRALYGQEVVFTDEENCSDWKNHKVCPATGDKHDWYKPHPRPEDHKYQCLGCGHYELDDYR